MKTRNLLLALLCVAPMFGSAQPGTLDATFGDDSGLKYFNFLSNDEEWMTHMAVDNQNRIWVAGETIQDGEGEFAGGARSFSGFHNCNSVASKIVTWYSKNAPQ